MITYTCKKTNEEGTLLASWAGSIDLICNLGPQVKEIRAEGRGSGFTIIAGIHVNGYFLALPDKGFAMETAPFSDVSWNTKKLTQYLPEVDAITIATGLDYINDL